ncbi:transposase family protein [Tistrella bauzanensis]|uniref:transposase family protein n=1 Tax=Tistrella TaxID=171436 RepID=UPI0031F7212A
MAMQEWWSAKELATLAKDRGINAFPGSERGVQLHASREGWAELGPSRCRRRAGRGGGLEYHYLLLPDPMRAAIELRDTRAQLAVRHEAEVARDDRRVAALRASALPARERAVMEARAEVLRSIEGYAIAQGQTRAWAIAQFLEAVADALLRQDLESRRDDGLPLTEREVTSLGRPLVLTAVDGFDLSVRRLIDANDRRGTASISRATLYTWFKDRDEGGVPALAPATTKKAQPVPACFATFLKFYAMPNKPTVSDALDQYKAAHPEPEMQLTIDQVRYILRTRMNNIERHVGREGLLTLRARLPYVTRTTEDMWPTTVYTADGKTFGAEVLDPVSNRPIRPEITTVLDVVTRKGVGIAVSRKENVIAVTEALRKACAQYGIPAIFYADRGPGYKNKTFDADVSGLMGRLGITKMHARAYNSQAKGLIERPNSTIWDVLAKRMPSYIGDDADKEAKKKAHQQSRRDLRTIGSTRTMPTWDEFLSICEAWIERYNDQPHRGLPRIEDPETGKRRHMSPNEAWEAHARNGFEPITISADEADDLFRPYEVKTALRGYVSWNNNKYFDHALAPLHGTRVMVGYDYAQADRVWVREYDVESGQPGRLICVARFEANSARYVPLTYERAALEKRAKTRIGRLDKHRAAAIAELRAPLLEAPVQAPMPIIESVPAAEPVPVTSIAPAAAATRRRVFASDEDLAAWALLHPGEVTAGQARVLRRCLMTETGRDLLRVSGVDTDALRDVLRAVA